MKTAARPCPLCGNTDHSTILVPSNFDADKLQSSSFASRKNPEYMHFQMIICPDCTLCYATPIPQLSWFEQEYIGADFNAAAESRYAAQSYARCLKKKISHLDRLDDALDIGTGDGAFLGELLKLGFSRVRGIEPSRAPLAWARPEVAPFIEQGFFTAEKFAPQSFSLISCFQTIEHLTDPAELFTAAFTLLQPGGCLFIAAHDYRSFSARLLGRHSPIFDIEHLQLLSSASAASFYRRAGFIDVDIFPLLNRYPLSYWLRLLPLGDGLQGVISRALAASAIGRLPLTFPAGNIAGLGFKPRDGF